MHKTFNSIPKNIWTILIILFSVLLIIIIFSAGLLVGYRRGETSERWNGHYSEIMGGRRSPLRPISESGEMITLSHGAAGQIVAVNLPSIVIRGAQEIEKMILIGNNTVIRKFRDTATTSDIVVGSWIVALGNPNEKGEIQASLIRLMPPPPEFASTTIVGVPQVY